MTGELEGVHFQPKPSSRGENIYAGVLPPPDFVAALMDFSMMPPAYGDSEFITDLAPECPVLSKAQMMGIRRGSAAYEARLFRNILYVLAVTNPARFG